MGKLGFDCGIWGFLWNWEDQLGFGPQHSRIHAHFLRIYEEKSQNNN